MITLQQFRAILPRNREPQAWHEIAINMFKKYDITTTNRIAGFMAQCGHESVDFNILEENLNYSQKALNSVFGRYFGPGKRNAAEYARNPKKIANYVYMDQYRSARGALGNTQPGDGWRFRGRGIKQLTGRNNYTAFANSVGMTAEQAAEYVSTKQGAFESACWFWKTNNIAAYADRGDIVGMSKRINGGTIGLDDRTRRWNKALSILGGKSSAYTESTRSAILRVGSRGAPVAKLQTVLGIKADGIFGRGTEQTLKQWQARNSLTADGIAGPTTLRKLGLR